MDAIVDIARDFRISIPTEPNLTFTMPAKIIFNKDEDQHVEVKVGSEEQGDYSIDVNENNFSGFSPPENLHNSFELIFNYYFLQTVKEKIGGQEIENLYVIIPLSASIAFENLLWKSMENKCNLKVHRDVEVYAAYYLEESRDLPEMKRFSQEDEGGHVYGIISSGDSRYIVLYNYLEGEPPGIIDFVKVKTLADLPNTFEMMIKNHSSDKSRIFYFDEGEVEGINKDIEIEPGKKIPLRRLRKKSDDENPFIKGVLNLNSSDTHSPVYQLALYYQESGTDFLKITPGKDLGITVEFPDKIPTEFFINFLVGPNSSNLIFINRLFVEIGAMLEKEIQFKGKVEKLEKGLKVNLLYKDKIDKSAFFRLREAYRLID
ncbi:MAG: hypothetical protein JSV88_31580 [Candidatus Aminicenantes bacterium]|nr:MAG: hypothetical protein JSV88_31580 [Candidatus Aminicenantes bacterium]